MCLKPCVLQLGKITYCLGFVIDFFFFVLSGNIRNISPAVWSLQHLTSLYLNDNCLSRIPAEIARLEHLMYLDLSCNKIRSLPAEIGELTRLR